MPWRVIAKYPRGLPIYKDWCVKWDYVVDHELTKPFFEFGGAPSVWPKFKGSPKKILKYMVDLFGRLYAHSVRFHVKVVKLAMGLTLGDLSDPFDVT